MSVTKVREENLRTPCAQVLSKRSIDVTGVSVTGRHAEEEVRKRSRKRRIFTDNGEENHSILQQRYISQTFGANYGGINDFDELFCFSHEGRSSIFECKICSCLFSRFALKGKLLTRFARSQQLL